jgi:hypothetical protein
MTPCCYCSNVALAVPECSWAVPASADSLGRVLLVNVARVVRCQYIYDGFRSGVVAATLVPHDERGIALVDRRTAHRRPRQSAN